MRRKDSRLKLVAYDRRHRLLCLVIFHNLIVNLIQFCQVRNDSDFLPCLNKFCLFQYILILNLPVCLFRLFLFRMNQNEFQLFLQLLKYLFLRF